MKYVITSIKCTWEQPPEYESVRLIVDMPEGTIPLKIIELPHEPEPTIILKALVPYDLYEPHRPFTDEEREVLSSDQSKIEEDSRPYMMVHYPDCHPQRSEKIYLSSNQGDR